jgi:hypothetical protein
MTMSGQNSLHDNGINPLMKLSLIFLMIDERPQQLMYVCPVCGHQNFIPAVAELNKLPCRACGMGLDATVGELEVLKNGSTNRDMDEESRLLPLIVR